MRPTSLSYLPLSLMIVGHAAIATGYEAIGAPRSALGALLAVLGTPLFAAVWADTDARRNRRLPCFDFGLFFLLAWPVSLAWYCLWTRRWRGLLLLLGLAGMFACGSVAAVALLHLFFPDSVRYP